MSFTRYGSLEGRTVIITGGASGIGACFVRAFVENGAKVAFLDLQRETGAALADSLGECAARPLFVPCDLTDTATLRAALSEIRTALGPAAVLINNAANDQRYEFDQITPEQFDRTIAVNFRHVFFAAQAIVPQMRDLGYGSIVNCHRYRGSAASRCSRPMPRPRRRSSASPIRSPGRWGRTASGSTRSHPAPCSPSASASYGFRPRRRSRRHARRNAYPT